MAKISRTPHTRRLATPYDSPQIEATMRATVRRWGNSLVLCIPSEIARDAHLRDGAAVAIALEGGRLVVVPVAVPELSLDALLAGITAENVHGEHPADDPRGAEAW